MADGFVTKPNYDTMKVGTIIQALFNPDPTKFLALDGGDYNAGDWPELVNDATGKRIFPGVFTSTARTLTIGAPAVAVISTHSTGTQWIAASSAGTNPLQVSSDGITWSGNASWTAATAVASMILAGSRTIMAPSAGETQPYVTSYSGSDATLAGRGNWTVTTGGSVTTLTQGLAYGSTANSGAGRTVLCKDGSLATASGLFYMNDGATVWNACSGGSTQTRQGVVWTGKYFIAYTAGTTIQISSDGATFADQILTVSLDGFMVSDGNGTVVSTASGNFVVSKDHGANWKIVTFPWEANAISGVYLGNTNNSFFNVGSLAFTNGLFFAFDTTKSFQTLASRDGITWTVEPITKRGIAQTIIRAIAYKAGTYCGIISASTAALTSVENTAKFRIPIGTLSAGSNGYGGPTTNATAQSFIKARS